MTAPSPDAVEVYMETMHPGELLTADEETALFVAYQAGDRSAYEELLQRNLRLVLPIAQRYKGQGLPLADLIQEGNLGLMRAIEKFDLSRGCRLSTYATPWIRQSIGRAVGSQRAGAARLPEYMIEKLGQVGKARLRLYETLEREPTDSEIATELGGTLDALAERLPWLGYSRSIDYRVTSDNGRGAMGDDTIAVIDMIADEGESVEATVLEGCQAEAVQDLLTKVLSGRHLDVMRALFGLGCSRQTLEEVGATLHISRERVRQLRVYGLKKLRASGAAHHLEEWLN